MEAKELIRNSKNVFFIALSLVLVVLIL
jgi:hypothetical protein